MLSPIFVGPDPLSQRDFDEFARSPVAVLYVKRRPRASFLDAVGRYFTDEYRERVRIGSFDPSTVPTPAWLMKRLFREPLSASWHCAVGSADAPEGYYLLKAGRPVAYHDGQTSEDIGVPAGIGLVARLAGSKAIARDMTAIIDKKRAQAVIDHFEAVLAAPPPPKQRRAAQPRGARPQVPSTPGPYERLSIAPTASDSEVKAAYKKAMGENHPDKVAHMSAAIRAAADQETRAVKAAYEWIRKERGL